MQIRPTNHIQTTQAVNLQPQNTTAATSNTTASAPVDQLDISVEAQAMTGTEVTSTVRADRVADIKLQIANGEYDTAERLEAAVSRMFNEFA